MTALSGEKFDLLVIGGGITGCGVARDAAMRGLKVALVERDDFASGTSGQRSGSVRSGDSATRLRFSLSAPELFSWAG